MTFDERLKSSPQPERPTGNVRRLVPRTQVRRTPQIERQSLDVAHLPQQRPDNDDDPGPSAA
jgi:hypothetical protein